MCDAKTPWCRRWALPRTQCRALRRALPAAVRPDSMPLARPQTTPSSRTSSCAPSIATRPSERPAPSAGQKLAGPVRLHENATLAAPRPTFSVSHLKRARKRTENNMQPKVYPHTFNAQEGCHSASGPATYKGLICTLYSAPSRCCPCQWQVRVRWILEGFELHQHKSHRTCPVIFR